MHKWQACPNCNRTPEKGWLSGGFFPIYQCKRCQRLFCYKCGLHSKDCPYCGSSDKKEAGRVYG